MSFRFCRVSLCDAWCYAITLLSGKRRSSSRCVGLLQRRRCPPRLCVSIQLWDDRHLHAIHNTHFPGRAAGSSSQTRNLCRSMTGAAAICFSQNATKLCRSISQWPKLHPSNSVMTLITHPLSPKITLTDILRRFSSPSLTRAFISARMKYSDLRDYCQFLFAVFPHTMTIYMLLRWSPMPVFQNASFSRQIRRSLQMSAACGMESFLKPPEADHRLLHSTLAHDSSLPAQISFIRTFHIME